MDTIGAYVLTDKRSKKFYVGSSQNIRMRLDRHFRELKAGKHHCSLLQDVWNKNACLIITPLPTDTREEAYQIEKDILERFQDSGQLLNVGKGVIGGDNLSRNPNKADIVKRISETLITRMGALTSIERKMLFGKPGQLNGMYGKTHSPATRAILSRINSNEETYVRLASYKKTLNYRNAISKVAKLRIGEKNPFFGKTHSEETKQKISASRLGIIPSNVRAVGVDGVVFSSVSDASRALKLSSPLLLHRLKSVKEKYSGYKYLNETSND